MNPRTALVTLALLGTASTASAAPIDELATADLSAFADGAAPAPGVQERSRSAAKSSGAKSVTRTRTQGPGGNQGYQVSASNGQGGTRTGTRVVQQHDGANQSVHASNGDWISRDTSGTSVRNRVTESNGTQTRSVEWGADRRTTEIGGVRDGERFEGEVNGVRGGVQGTRTNGATGAVETRSGMVRGEHAQGTIGPRTIDRSVVVRSQQGAPGRPGAVGAMTRPGTGTLVRPGVVDVGRPGVGPRDVALHGPRPATVVHTVRPTTVVHSGRPTTVVHTGRPGGVRHVAYGRSHVTYAHVRPYHGVFVYGPRPVSHVRYVEASGPAQVRKDDLPDRAIDRTNSLAVGLKGGSMVSADLDGDYYGDPGVGLMGRYRPAEAVGLELGLQHHAGSFSPETKRSQTQVAGSVELFAFPWARVSPYVLGGATYNAANINDEIFAGEALQAVQSVDAQWGLHGGLGLELALGNTVAIDLEGRYIGWLDERYEGEAPGALQVSAGLLFHFK